MIVSASEFGYHGWAGTVVKRRGLPGRHCKLVPVEFPANSDNVGWFMPENLVLDVVAALGDLANE